MTENRRITSRKRRGMTNVWYMKCHEKAIVASGKSPYLCTRQTSKIV